MTSRAVIAIALLARAAAADPAREDAISTQPFELAARGGEVGLEHLVRAHWSVFGFVGLRGAALGDYTSTTYAGGAELRWWWHAAMTGFYAAAHLDLGRTSLALSGTDGEMGVAWGVEERVDAGWRFTIQNRVAITPSLGLGAHHDIDTTGSFAVYTRPALAVGLELAFLF